MRLNVRDFDSVDAAVAAAADGDTIYLPAPGPYSSSGLVIDKSISLIGDGPGIAASELAPAVGSVLQPLLAEDPVPLITIAGPVRQVHIRGIQLRSVSGNAPDAIVCESTNPDMACSELTIQNVLIHRFPGDGIRLIGYSTGSGRIARVTVADSTIDGCGVGLRLINALDVMALGVLFTGNAVGGCVAETSSISLHQCTFKGNAASALDSLDANLKLDRCMMARVDGCRFLDIQAAQNKLGCSINKGTAVISACYFSGNPAVVCKGILLTGSGGGPYAVMSQRFKGINTLVQADTGVRNLMLLAQYDETGGSSMSIAEGALVYGAPGIIRESASDFAGLYVPTFASDPTAGVVPGMLIYNTTIGALRFRTSSQWKTVSTGPII
jgi:hypothetical protein